ncbi:putative RING-H2 finger protein ATL21A [Syzygium oleosum]|uniref:putative RING-H2 finger protein ATL21A n=1 Tax=Syzygium oleosum TaxID=219896 RepID=UPI0024B8C153|nr:putative RING-H2 finger protein ATL21A [Syzygium oleosum]
MHNQMAYNLSIPFFFSTSSSFFFLLHLVSPLPSMCYPESCGANEPDIRFPFGLKQFQPDERCVYPWFDLSCNGQNRTTLSIPLSGEFTVVYIDYAQRAILIQDPDDCLPNRLPNFTPSSSNWLVQQYTKFTFFKCPMESQANDTFPRMPCLDGQNYYVVVVPTDNLSSHSSLLPSELQCNYSHDISIPTMDNDFMWNGKLSIGLTWNEPFNCSDCATRGETCGFKGKKGLETGCIVWQPNTESPKRDTTSQWIILEIFATCFMFTASMVIAHKLRARCLAQRDRTNPSSLPSQALALAVISGLDTPTIESYPTTCVGDVEGSMPQDNSCSICLLEYKSKEVLRTLPECKHSFHVHCIDPWLKRKASCPVCRNHQGSAKSTVSTQGEDTSYADDTIGNQHVTQQVD